MGDARDSPCHPCTSCKLLAEYPPNRRIDRIVSGVIIHHRERTVHRRDVGRRQHVSTGVELSVRGSESPLSRAGTESLLSLPPRRLLARCSRRSDRTAAMYHEVLRNLRSVIRPSLFTGVLLRAATAAAVRNDRRGGRSVSSLRFT